MFSVAVLILALTFATLAFWGAATISIKGIAQHTPAAVVEGALAFGAVIAVSLVPHDATPKVAALAAAVLLGLHALPRRTARSTGALAVAVVSIIGVAAVKLGHAPLIAFCFAAIAGFIVVRGRLRMRARHLAHA